MTVPSISSPTSSTASSSAGDLQTKEKKQLFYLILPCALLVLFFSLEVLMQVKDPLLFAPWQEETGGDFAAYLNFHLFRYLGHLLYPVGLALYSLFTVKKYGISSLFQLVWGCLGLASLVQLLLAGNFSSLFFYLEGLAYLAILLVLAWVNHSERFSGEKASRSGILSDESIGSSMPFPRARGVCKEAFPGEKDANRGACFTEKMGRSGILSDEKINHSETFSEERR